MSPEPLPHLDHVIYAEDDARSAHQDNHHHGDPSTPTSQLETTFARDQAASLASQVRLGEDRVIVDPPNWSRMTSTELHDAATKNNDPQTADALGRKFTTGGNRLVDATNQLSDAIGKLAAGWTGAAADSARGALTDLARSTGQIAATAQDMGAKLSQVSVAAEAVLRLPPPTGFDQQKDVAAAVASANPITGMADYKLRADEDARVRAEQVRYLTAYTRAMAAIDAATPTFLSPSTTLGANNAGTQPVVQQGQGPDGPGDPQGVASTPTRPGGSRSESALGPAPTQLGSRATSQANHQRTTQTPQSTSQQGVYPAQSGSGLYGQDGSAGRPRPGSEPFTPATTGVAVPGQDARSGFGADARRYGGPGAVGPRSPAGSRGGPGGFSGREPASGPAGTGREGRLGGSGRGVSGMDGPGVGGQRTKGDEDTEHHRPDYLRVHDPESVFGTDEPAFPAVID